MATNKHNEQDPCVKQADAKQAALINDQLFPMPRQRLLARDILDQAGAGKDLVLIRDHGSPHDVVFTDDAEVNLSHGNVFRTAPRCEAGSRARCDSPAKLAFVCNDAWEVTVIGDQTEHSLKRLFGLPAGAELFRDLESPNDVAITPGERVHFIDGPVFRTKTSHGNGDGITIFVNGRPKTVHGKTISYEEVVRLADVTANPKTLPTVNYKKGPPSKPEGEMVRGYVVNLICEMEFYVCPTSQS